MPAWLIALLVGLAITLALAWEGSRGRPRSYARPQLSTLISAGMGIGAAAVVALVSWAMLSSLPAPEPPAAPPPEPAVEDVSPIHGHLSIPSLGLETPIMRVPLADGEWDISSLSAQVGWLEGTGTQPGGEQAIALIGHVTLTARERGPFADLWTLAPLEEIVYRAGERRYVYSVSEVKKIRDDDVNALTRWDGALQET
jgi:hypothetical protein